MNLNKARNFVKSRYADASEKETDALEMIILICKAWEEDRQLLDRQKEGVKFEGIVFFNGDDYIMCGPKEALGKRFLCVEIADEVHIHNPREGHSRG